MGSKSYKVVLLGEGRVGKTSLISRYTQNTFSDTEQSTVQASMYAQASVPLLGHRVTPGAATAFDEETVDLPSSLPSAAHGAVSVAIWDTAGQERYHALAPIYYRNADGAMLVFDVCDKQSLDRVRTWTQELRAVAGHHIELVICGNKVDQPAASHEVKAAEANALAIELGAALVWTSAKTGLNVAQAFSTMATVMTQAAGMGGREVMGSSPAVALAGRTAQNKSGKGITPPRPRRGQLQVVEDNDARAMNTYGDQAGDRDTHQRVSLAERDPQATTGTSHSNANGCC